MSRWMLLLLAVACAPTPERPIVDEDADGFESILAGGDDCDDADPNVHPDADEVCDGIDNDCDRFVDDRVTIPFYVDADGDGFGDPDSEPIHDCAAPDGHVQDAADCDDADPDVNPDAAEVCNEIDDDCDGEIDPDLLQTFYADLDADGFGDPDESVEACEAPSSYVEDDTDCDDFADDVNPDGVETCDERDEDCDGQVDEGADDPLTWFLDADLDGYGDPAHTFEACDAPSGYVSDDEDCDDEDATSYPDAEELCDGVDNDCDGDVDEDPEDGRDTVTCE